jgi:DNA-binding GntR family transcriptional regulator
MKGFRPDLRPVDGSVLTGHRAYDELRRRILTGDLPQGAVVNEVAQAESLGISRTPVREAFRELLNEGLLEGTGPRRQVTVRTLGRQEVGEIATARRALESVTASAASTRVNAALVVELELVVERMDRAVRRGDLQAFLDADDEFHAALSASAAMPTIDEFLARLRALSRIATVPDALSGDCDLVALHRDIVAILAQEGGQRARPAAALLARCTEVLVGA